MLEYQYRQTFGQNEEEKQLRAVVPGEGSAELLQLQHVADLADTGRRHPFAAAHSRVRIRVFNRIRIQF